ncbi:hypothetical protein SLEP1_g36568 [Rubroshorea leprosula]|uniref:Uncharacterized protein n=1 Tax=Rubroshorea leprosula TaxID=152421 RepID=A0AAV5KSB7_9ROSI|nr:hypothetical protein SLEP1_g36568 [Rubroshorea leprosula]
MQLIELKDYGSRRGTFASQQCHMPNFKESRIPRNDGPHPPITGLDQKHHDYACEYRAPPLAYLVPQPC